MINELTSEQEAKIPVYLNKWLKNGRSTNRLDQSKAIEAVKNIYKCANLEEPKYFFFFPSPIQCQLAVNVLKNTELKTLLGSNLVSNLGDNLGNNLWNNLRNNLWNNLGNNLWHNLRNNLGDNLGNNLWNNLGNNLWNNLGNNLWNNLVSSLGDTKLKYEYMYYGNADWDTCWIGFYDYILNELFEDKIKMYTNFIQYLEAMKNIHAFIPYKEIVFISDRPLELHINSKGQLHKDLEPSLIYEDGYALFYLNGVKVPKYIIESEGIKLDTLKVMGEQNVEVRREGLRKIPIDKLIKDTGAKELDSWREYTLYDMDFKDNKIRRVLRMKNPSIDAEHFERVEDNINTCQEALAWRNGLTLYTNPKELT